MSYQVIKELLLESSGAFFGAFFAFLFGLWTVKIQKTKDRIKLHKNAMVELEYLLNEHLNGLSRIHLKASGSIAILSSGKYTYNRIHKLRLPQDIELNLANLDLINDYVDYKEDVDRINEDVMTWNRANEILREVVLSGKIPEQDIALNAKHLVDQLKLIITFVNKTIVKAKRLLVIVRLKMVIEGNLYTQLVWYIHRRGKTALTHNDIATELRVLEKEIQDNTLKM